jgi:DNA polymerase-1
MQGSAADIIKRAMIAVADWLRREDPGARLIMQVHDELVLEVPTGQLDAVQAAVCELMADAADLAVPLKVDAGSGRNWDQAH